MEIIRITSREVYAYYLKSEKVSGCCTNKKLLVRNTGISYNVFRRVFDRGNNYCYEDDIVIIIRIKSAMIEKGDRSISRRGRGGMEQFVRYIKNREY